MLLSIFNSQAQITDIDGNSYDTVRIGTQTWMAENLNVSRFRNGDVISEARTRSQWIKACKTQQPAWCYYKNKKKNGEKYGKIYNYFAVHDQRGLAPENWHIGNHDDWYLFIDSICGEPVSLSEIPTEDVKNITSKIKSTNGWKQGQNGSDSLGFCALPSGLRNNRGFYLERGYQAIWWVEAKYRVSWHSIYDKDEYDWEINSRNIFYNCENGHWVEFSNDLEPNNEEVCLDIKRKRYRVGYYVRCLKD
jgi:uncharacterized protein (TIGR02145 family)